MIDVTKYLNLPARVIGRIAPGQVGNEDLIQDCYEAMLIAAPTYKGYSKPSTFLYAVCARTVYRYLDRKTNEPEPLRLSDIKQTKDEQAETKLDHAAFNAVLCRLPPLNAAVVKAYIGHEYTIAPAAKELGLSPRRFKKILIETTKYFQ